MLKQDSYVLQIYKRFQQQAAFIEFSEGHLEEAMELFKNCQIDVREVRSNILQFVFSDLPRPLKDLGPEIL